MNDVSVLYTDIKDFDHPSRLEELSAQLPAEIVQELKAFGSLNKKISRAAGRILMMKALEHAGFSPELVSRIEKDENGKPFIKNGPYFNISHSSEIVVCAVSEKYPLGIDVEKVRDINVENFRKYLHENEWLLLEKKKFDRELFFTAWTRKEASLKAEGTGIRIPIGEIDTTQDSIQVKKSRMKVKKLELAEGYSSHLAVVGDLDFKYLCQGFTI